MKNIKFPTPHTILLLIAGFVAVLTWFIPAGKFDTLQYQEADNSFVYKHLEEEKTMPVNQETLESLGIKIPLEKFTSGDIAKPISVPGTYTQLDPKPQGFLDFLNPL